MKKFMSVVAAMALAVVGAITFSTSAQADDGGITAEKCVVTPAKTVVTEHDAVTHDEFRWKQDIPAVEEVSHLEFRFFRDVPKVDAVTHEIYQFSRVNPGSDEVSHEESRYTRMNPGQQETFTTKFKYEKVVPAVEGVEECQYKKWVKDTKTQYQYAKFTQTKTRTSEIWANFSPNKKHEPYVGPPSWPTDPDGKWEIHGDIPGGHAGADGVYQKGTGNGSWFYRHGVGTWSDFGPWTLWSPLTHVTWEDFNQPSIGSPAFHGSGSDDGTDWYRQWQARNTGETRQVPNGGHWEYQWATENPGEGWIKTDNCRWKIEPKDAYTVLYEDGAWTTDTPGDPWVKTAEQAFGNGDAVAPFAEYATHSGRTTDPALAEYFTDAEAATFDRGWSKYGDPKVVVDEEAVAPFTEYKTEDGATTDPEEADWFTQPSFEGWILHNQQTIEDSAEIPGFREYKTTDGTTKVLDEADYFVETGFEGWTQLDSKKVVTVEFVPGYTIYYVEDGEPTLVLGDENWTEADPGEPWVFVDGRTVEDAKAYSTEKTSKAVYGDCSLAYTGADGTAYALMGAGLFSLLGLMLVMGARIRRRA